MAECKYYSFYALAKINDPELLYEAFQQQIAPGHADEIEIEVFERGDSRWNRLIARLPSIVCISSANAGHPPIIGASGKSCF